MILGCRMSVYGTGTTTSPSTVDGIERLREPDGDVTRENSSGGAGVLPLSGDERMKRSRLPKEQIKGILSGWRPGCR